MYVTLVLLIFIQLTIAVNSNNGVNREDRVKRYVQLTEEGEEFTVYEKCELPDGRSGHCRLMRSCFDSELKENQYKYLERLCLINGNKIGVCCSDDADVGVAGDLPQTVSKNDVNDLLRASNEEVIVRGCGVSTSGDTRRVFESSVADPHEWPWMAAILPDGKDHHCGGVIITERHVLTAAHCVSEYINKPGNVTVRLGDYDLSRINESRSLDMEVVEITIHSHYEEMTYRNDIAIIKLKRLVFFNTYIWPICLPIAGETYAGQSGVVIGWGTQWYGGPNSEILMQVTVPIWSNNQCKEVMNDGVYPETLCAGGEGAGKDACQNDSGGPLLVRVSSGRWAVAGIVSWGTSCGEENTPGIYTRVSSYLKWIVEHIHF